MECFSVMAIASNRDRKQLTVHATIQTFLTQPITCLWHVFMNSESMNPRNFFTNFSCFLLKLGRIFLLRSKMLLKLFIFTKRHFLAPLKENIREKNSWIRRLEIREKMSRASY